MIPRVYVDGSGAYWIEIDYEWQTSFSAGYLESGDNRRYDLSGCARPCRVHGAGAQGFVDFLLGNRNVKVVFTDYLVQDSEIDVDLDGFNAGLDSLRRMQALYPS